MSESAPEPSTVPFARLGRAIGRTRYVVLLAVLAVILVAVALFLLGSVQAVAGVWHAGRSAFGGTTGSTEATVEFLEIVSTMLKAVVFYLVGVGLYSLFIAPLNVTAALGVESLSDLESKVVSVVVVIMAVTFLGHFVRWEAPAELMPHAASLALVVGALVLFQFHNHRANEDQKANDPDGKARAKRALFVEDKEGRDIAGDESATRGVPSRPDEAGDA